MPAASASWNNSDPDYTTAGKHVGVCLEMFTYKLQTILIDVTSSDQWHLEHVCTPRSYVATDLLDGLCGQFAAKQHRSVSRDFSMDPLQIPGKNSSSGN